MSAHHEPWTFDRTSSAIYIKDANKRIVCYENLSSVKPDERAALQSQFERIVKCVNACARIEDPETAIPGTVKHLEKIVSDSYGNPLSVAHPSTFANQALNLLNPKTHD